LKFKRALVSVSDKTGLVDLLRPLVQEGLQVVSTGGTAQHLRSNGISCISVSEITEFPEVMGGRVKTLHPKIHMSLLARPIPEDTELLENFGLKMFDLVVCNLYPFEKVSAREGVREEELIEHIDIGGPTMLRAAAKNFSSVVVLCDPKDYLEFLENRKEIDLNHRKKWASKVFQQTSKYDGMIAQRLQLETESVLKIHADRFKTLRYGENAHQSATWFVGGSNSNGLHTSQIIQGKELSYNNLLDLEAACSLVRLFKEPTTVAVKHNNPCGVSSHQIPLESLKRAISSDSVSVFGGIIALNSVLDFKMAQVLHELFLECIIAPEITPEAQELFSKKKNLRVLIWPGINDFVPQSEIRSISGGFLVQSADLNFGKIETWQSHENIIPDSIREDMIFGEKICSFLKSNAIALVKDKTSVGLGMGQVNRIDALEQAVQRWKKFHSNIQEPILVSDAFFPFTDTLELAHKNGIRWILQPGGSVRDEEVKLKAKELGVGLIFSGVRHFKH